MNATSTLPTPVQRLRTWASFVRFEHTLFTLPLILAGIFSVPGAPMTLGRWLLVAVAAVGARTSAMSLNRLIDRQLDALNPRTRTRELPSGKMKLAEAWGLLLGAMAVYFAAAWKLDPIGLLYVKLAPIPLVVFTLYPYTKRFTPFCHFGVGAGMCMAPLAGYAAAHPDLAYPWTAVWLAAFTLLWGSGFDIIYSTLDEESDRANGVHSMIVWRGRKGGLRVSGWLHAAASLALMLVLASMPSVRAPGALHFLYTSATGILCGAAIALLYLEQKLAEDVNLAFFRINVWVSAVVLAMVLMRRAVSGGF